MRRLISWIHDNPEKFFFGAFAVVAVLTWWGL